LNIFLKLIIFGILFTCITSAWIQQSFAQNLNNKPDNYEISIEVTDVGNIDLGTGSFEMVFWIHLSSDKINFYVDPPPELDYVNAKEFTIVSNRTTQHEYSAKISGTFFVDELDFKLYPYMNMDMKIKIGPAGQESDQVKFTLDKDEKGVVLSSGLIGTDAKSEVLIPGWINHNAIFNVAEEKYDNPDRTFSRFTATYPIEKPFLSSFVVGILPVIIMGVIATITFVLDPIRQEFKAGVIGGILMAAVFFQVASVDQIPSLEYLTLADKVITTFYVILIVMMIELLAQWKYNAENNEVKAQKINKKFRVILPIAAIIVFVVIYQI